VLADCPSSQRLFIFMIVIVVMIVMITTVLVVAAMIATVVVPIMVVPPSVMAVLSKIDDDTRFAISVSVSPMASSPHDGAAPLRPYSGAWDCTCWSGENGQSHHRKRKKTGFHF
jgi:hypothetical protein